VQVITDLPAGQPNAFYMDPVDLAGVPIALPLANQPEGAPVDPVAMNGGDPITFDQQDGLHKAVTWKGRKIRQRDYSFDYMSSASAAGFGGA
jgi:hypothetical protein